MNKKYKISIYEDNRMKIQYNRFNPFQNKNTEQLTYVVPARIHNSQNPYLKTKSYARTLRKKRQELFELKLDPNNCVFLTLTTQNNMNWKNIVSVCSSFIKSLKRNFEGVKYIKTIECLKNEYNHFHIHMLLIFPSSIPINFNQKWVEKHWRYGKQIKLLNTFDPYGVIEYMTQFKKCNIDNDDKNYTKYPEWVKFLTNSQDIPKSSKYEIEITEDELPKFYARYEEKYKQETGKEPFCFSDGHYYIDNNELRYHLDKEFIH